MLFYLRLDIQATMSYNPGMSKQTVTFAKDRYVELIEALQIARVSKIDKFEKRVVNHYQEATDQYQKSSRFQRWFQRWFFGIEKYESLEDYKKNSPDHHFSRHFHKEFIKKIDDMVDMLKTNPPPDAVTVDYDFWISISKEQP